MGPMTQQAIEKIASDPKLSTSSTVDWKTILSTLLPALPGLLTTCMGSQSPQQFAETHYDESHQSYDPLIQGRISFQARRHARRHHIALSRDDAEMGAVVILDNMREDQGSVITNAIMSESAS